MKSKTFLVIHLFDRAPSPRPKSCLRVLMYVPNRVSGVVLPFQVSSKAHHRIGNGHRLPPFSMIVHGPEVLLLAGPVGQPGVAPGHLQAGVAEKVLQTLEPHSRIEQLACKGVAKAVEGVALVGKLRPA